jgi:hypothetical protein
MYGNGSDGTSVCTDAVGNIFIAGIYYGQVTAGSFTLSATGNYSPYLIKYNSSGSVLWAKTAVANPSSPNDWGLSVCSDAGGNVLMTGFFSGPAISFGTYTLTNTGHQNMFLVKYDPNGNVLWAKNPIDTAYDCAYSISCDANNNIYATGTFSNNSIVFGTNTLTGAGNGNLFTVKYDANGNVLWAKSNSFGDVFGNNNFGTYVSADASGNTFVAGSFSSPTVVFGTYTLTNSGTYNVFFIKYDPSGNILWAKSANVINNQNMANSVSTDGPGNAYITGSYGSPSIVFGTYTLTGGNAFIAKYDANGNVLWAKSSGGYGKALSVSSYSAGAFVTGVMADSISLGTYTVKPPLGYNDAAFFAQYDGNGNVVFAKALATGGDDWIAVATDAFCNAYLTGDMDVNTFVIGTNTLTQSSGEHTFLAKFSFNCLDVGFNEHKSLDANSNIFPNPNNDSFKILINEKFENGELILINSIGQWIYEQKISQGLNEINAIGLENGLYYYLIRQNNQTFKTGKIAK